MRPYGTDVGPVDAAFVKGFLLRKQYAIQQGSKNGQISKKSKQHDISQHCNAAIFILYCRSVNKLQNQKPMFMTTGLVH